MKEQAYLLRDLLRCNISFKSSQYCCMVPSCIPPYTLLNFRPQNCSSIAKRLLWHMFAVAFCQRNVN